MTLDEIKKFLSDNKENADVKAYLETLNGVNLDNVKAFLDANDEGKKLLQSLTDAKVTQGIETFKKNNLDKLVNDGVSKKYTELHPEETPEQKRIREIEAKLSESEQREKRTELKNKALTLLTAKGLDASALDLINIGDDEASMKTNVDRYIQLHDADVQKEVTKKFKENGRDPHEGNGEGDFKGSNPWRKETFNLSEQGKLTKTLKPEIVAELKRAAGL